MNTIIVLTYDVLRTGETKFLRVEFTTRPRDPKDFLVAAKLNPTSGFC